MAYGYIYKTTNLINNKIYIGQHHYERNHIDPHYLGGGKNLHLAFKKYGKENFKCEILEWCDSFEELNEKETYWIKFYNSKDRRIGYNLDDGGQGIPGYHHTNEAKEKISKNNCKYWKGRSLHPNTIRASIESRKKLAAEGKLKGHKMSQETKEKVKLGLKKWYETHDHPNLGKHPTEETRQKLKESHLGQVAWNKGKNQSEETKKKVSEGLKKYFSTHTHYHTGQSVTEETKQKISATVSKINTGKKFINNGSINKFVTVKEAEKYFSLNEGWKYGRLSSQAFLKSRKNINKNNVWITNEYENKFIPFEDLKNFLNKGWKRGMTRKEKLKNGL